MAKHELKKYFVIANIAIISTCVSARTLYVQNTTNRDRKEEMIEISLDSMRLDKDAHYIVKDQNGQVLPSQVTHDGNLIFKTMVRAKSSSIYTVTANDSAMSFPSVAVGRIYPEHCNEIAWENENIGFRLYGPGNQAAGQKVYGYDIFFKHTSPIPMLKHLYDQETSLKNWAKADSLRMINPELAAEFISSFSYHIDHGLGMDCYAVGETLGAGAAALVFGDTICYPWCYHTARILDNGPLRFSVELDFAPVSVDNGRIIVEHRVISLDAGSYLNHCMVWYDGIDKGLIVAGFPRRDNSLSISNKDNGILAYADPTQRSDCGKALLGIIVPKGYKEEIEKFNHILVVDSLDINHRFQYYWGCAWDQENIHSLREWSNILSRLSEEINTPLTVSVID